MWVLAQDGKRNEKTTPNPLQFAVSSKAYTGFAYTTTIPIWVQKVGFTVLVPVARLIGCEAAYERRDGGENFKFGRDEYSQSPEEVLRTLDQNPIRHTYL